MKYTLSEDGNADRFIEQHRDALRYVPGIGWKEWDGKRWKVLTTDLPLLKVRASLARLEEEIEAEGAESLRSKMRTHLAKSRSEKSMMGMLRVAKSHPDMVTEASAFDAQPYLLNCLDGVVDMRTGELLPHDPALMQSKIAGVAYGAKAVPCLKWRAHVDTIMDEDEDMVDYVHRALGYTVSGSVDEQAIFVAFGTGANGKSVLLNVVAKVMGDYAQIADRNLLIKSTANAIGHNLVQLKGARFTLASETGAGNELDEVAVKMLTGSDSITGRKLYGNNVTFTPSAKIWLGTNHRPVVRSHDHGVWRRIKAVPFAVRIRDEDRIKDYHTKLFDTEGTGVLRWLVEGYQKWAKDGLCEPAEVQNATWEYQTGDDDYHIAEFVAEACYVAPRAQAGPARLYAAYEAWIDSHRDAADRPRLTKRALFKRLREFGGRLRTVTTDQEFEIEIFEGVGVSEYVN